MDFTPTDEQEMIRDSSRELFEKECPLDFVRIAWDDPSKGVALFERHLEPWLELAQGPLVDVMLFAEEHGRAVAPGPFLPSLLAQQVAQAVGLEVSGAATVAIADADGLWSANAATTKHFVPCVEDVETVVVVTGSPEAPRVALARASDVVSHRVEQMDGLRPMYRVDVAGTPSGRPVDPGAFGHALDRSLVTVSAELIGVGRHLLDTAVAYAKQREQFDRPIGSFQGLQWMLVDAALDLERAASAVAYAAMCVDADDPDRLRAVAGAKAEAGLAARHCAKTSVQVHGGVGYTWEQGVHYWLKRAYAGDAFMGPAAHHHDRLAAALFDESDASG